VSIKSRNSGLPFSQPYDSSSKFLAIAVKLFDLRELGLGRLGIFEKFVLSDSISQIKF
jgi:hypothetical protein